MRAHPALLALVVVLISSLVAVAAACGGESDGGNGGAALTLEEYFGRLGDLYATVEERTDALDEQFDEELSGLVDEDTFDEAEAADLFADSFEAGMDLIDNFLDELEELNPPAEVEEAHEAAVAAFRRMVAAFEELTERMRDADLDADIPALFSDPELVEAGEEYDEACMELQTIADLNGIELDLDCEDSE